MISVTYVVARNSNRKASALYRFRDDELGSSWEEELDENGVWVQDNSLMSVWMNLHNPRYEEISEKEAAEIAEQFGGSI